ncbi:Retrovirus-related Pol polyprotein from transposon TNT 1-94 [Quillaja saponaria]|uniref:Retrovirus-related Pol polyprotein from transposon TNT 1-94 n=1 Tax=Quillaja saponaria TaxID=32244 RepID=A0AAD7PYM6_QUISA|nr:Retrovirus-related Pol polyprotein from transposon TNT 1-94 [Quillaja saponaria]
MVPLITYMDQRTGRTIGTGRESHGLYHLTTLPTSSVTCSTDVSPILIHSRLGHPSLSKLQKMVPRLSYLSSLNCMLHQSSCSHTPQQNGVAERKNGHLIETARTLLLHGHVPLRFWGDAVLTACYLINRIPSSTLHNKIPYSIIFTNHPLYSLPLRIFGCICFVHDLIPGQDKLSFKSFKCIFLGYSRLQKGYKCYCPDKNRYFISVDVTFFEESSFFPSTIPESPSISEALSVPYLGPNDCVSSASLPDLPADIVDVPDDSPSILTPSRASDPASPPILRKGTCSTRNPYPIYTFFSYHRLSSPYYAFVSFLSSIFVPKSTSDALAHPG